MIAVRTPLLALCLLAVVVSPTLSQPESQHLYDSLAVNLFKRSLAAGKAYETLHELTSTIGHRLSGSPQAARAVDWAEAKMKEFGFENVHREPCMVPHWVRGAPEQAAIILPGGTRIPIKILALGGSIGTPKKGITASVIEVHSLAEAAALGNRAKGKIIFYNRPFDRTKFDTFEGYGGAVDQRVGGAVAAASVGGVLSLVRSITPRLDDVPHAGGMWYNDSIPKVPGVAVSTVGAEKLSELLKKDPNLKVFVKTSCETLPDVPSCNVVGELRGTKRPGEVIVMGGHLDSWDVGQGAHDDGSGVVQSMEALRLLMDLGLRPERTVRVVAFMNEENGARGGRAYAAKERPGETPIAAIESDRGGFMPRGFTTDADSVHLEKLKQWESLFSPIMADRIMEGEGGTDISFLAKKGAIQIGLYPEPARYFSYHHTQEDTFDKVDERELELGAACMAILSYVIAQEGI
jgi:carboxypeptidase Q